MASCLFLALVMSVGASCRCQEISQISEAGGLELRLLTQTHRLPPLFVRCPSIRMAIVHCKQRVRLRRCCESWETIMQLAVDVER